MCITFLGGFITALGIGAVALCLTLIGMTPPGIVIASVVGIFGLGAGFGTMAFGIFGKSSPRQVSANEECCLRC